MTNRQENPTPRENLLVVAVFIISLILVCLCAAGCCEVVWKMPEETGFYQPVVIARKS